VHAAVQRHILLTTLKLVTVTESQIFDLSSPKSCSSADHQILEVVPSSEQIIHDVDQVFDSMLIVRLASDIHHCPGVGSRNYEIQYTKVAKKRSGGSGHQKKKFDDYDDAVVHPDAETCFCESENRRISVSLARKEAILGNWENRGRRILRKTIVTPTIFYNPIRTMYVYKSRRA
jgi:hypothetical protein